MTKRCSLEYTMPPELIKEEKTMRKKKIILQVTRLLEKKDLISANERMKMTDIIRKGQ